MRQLFCCFLIAQTAILGCSKEPIQSPAKELPVEKKVVFSVFAANDYTSPFYNNFKAKVTMGVGRLSNTTGDITPIWDTTISGDLKSFPEMSQRIQFEKLFPVLENEEKLHISHIINYDNNGSKSFSAMGEPIPYSTRIYLRSVQL